MLIEKIYDRRRAFEYAKTWAFSRNPLFTDFTGIGGNCTNFVSQALFAGGCVMNFTPVFGWYYFSANDRTASWTGVEYLWDFLTSNSGAGPFGREVSRGEVMPGDIVQLGGREGDFYHSLFIVETRPRILICAHSNDALNMPLDTYSFAQARFFHIEGVRTGVPS